MKFFHTGDIFWGAMPEADKPWSRERARSIRETFTNIIRLARDKQMDLLLISGNLFSGQPSTADLRDINSLFLSVPKVRIVLTAGEQDRLTPSSAVLSFRWAPNAVFLSEITGSSIYFEDLNTEVHGFSWTDTTDPLELSLENEAPADGRIHLFLGCLPESASVTAPMLFPGFAYAALSGSHTPAVLTENRICIAGCPEPLGRTDTGAHGIYRVEISTPAAADSLEFIPMARASYISLTFRVTPATTAAALERTIDTQIRSRGPENIYLLKITGKHHPDEDFSFDSIRLRYHIADIEDLAEPEYDFGELFSEHPGDMIGFYIRTLSKPDMSPTEKKALYHGIRALLQTSDERRK